MKTYKMKINGDNYSAKIKKYKGTFVMVEVNGIDYGIELEIEKAESVKLIRSQKSTPSLNVAAPKPKPQVIQPGSVVAPIPGLILRIMVKEGDNVEAGDTILILEAMKMESEIASTASGTITKINIKEGASVQEGDSLIEVGE